MVHTKDVFVYIGLIAFSAGIGNTLGDDELPKYKMCVPHTILDACNKLVTTQPSEHAQIECVPARDRMECLEKVNRREADFLAVDPEDMYVAFRMKNEDFSVFSEIRTVEEPEAEFRYEGIILVHKNSDIHSLAALKGKKSCHTGYGRNVGYKIPITKLRKAGVLTTSSDSSLSPVEKELKGLSELFEKSCLVGKYSPNADINQVLKKRYSNLCALCEDPVKCDYPDKYSGYDGAIRCLAENGGEVAFTKVIYVRKFFGLSVGGQPPKTTAAADPNNFEYLCEDGSRKPVTGLACSWAQRPWQGYMGNSDLNSRLERLQHRIEEFYEKAKLVDPKTKEEEASKLWVSDKNVIVSKKQHSLPSEHLFRAQYKDVIERKGTAEQKIRICVKNELELKKCDVLRKAAYSRDIRPEFDCVVSSDCGNNVVSQQSDVAVMSRYCPHAKELRLQPVVAETYVDNFVVVAKKGLKDEVLRKTALQYDEVDDKSYNAGLLFNYKRDSRQCSSLTKETSQLRVLRASELKSKATDEHDELICLNLVRKPVLTNDLKDCTYDATPPKAVFTRESVSGHEFDNIVHAFTSLSDKFGPNGKVADVFELFGEFEPGKKNVIFSDDAVTFVSEVNSISNVDENLYNRIKCQN